MLIFDFGNEVTKSQLEVISAVFNSFFYLKHLILPTGAIILT